LDYFTGDKSNQSLLLFQNTTIVSALVKVASDSVQVLARGDEQA
jgi:hypothetical protein